MVRSCFAWMGMLCLACASAETDPPEVAKAREEYSRIEHLVEMGGLPKARLEQARLDLAEAQERAVLRQTLYGSLTVEQLTEPLARQMVDSARSLLATQQGRVTKQRQLVEAGVAGPATLTPFLEEMDFRRKTLDMAESRVRLWHELLEMARAEEARQAQLEADQLAALRMAEQDPGYGILSPARYRRLETEYERVFGHTLPVSAKGDTSFHRMMGFDHRGRVDVGVNPDSSEGRWLRSWLEGAQIPYLAFRGAVPGAATGAHIHIGPPSLKLRTAD